MIFLIIGVDIDNVLNNLCEAALSVYNFDSQDNLKVEDITSYYIEDFIKTAYQKTFFQYFIDSRVWKRIKVVEGCQEYLAKLYNDGHTILFITSTEPENLGKKARWLTRNFPYMNIRKSLFSCPTKQHMGEIDLLIDDYHRNLDNAKYKGILFDAPWNRKFECPSSIVRCKTWKEIYETIRKMEE